MTTTSTQAVTATVTQTANQFLILDDLGREVAVPAEAMRIVSLAPSNTEILFALGLADRVYGVTEWCDYPPEAMEKEKVGGYADVDLEKIIAINPDLILAEDLHKAEVIPALEELGYPVIALVPHNMQEVIDSITLVGMLTDTSEAAQQITDDMSQRVQAITDATAGLSQEDGVRVLYVVWHDPVMSVGSDTRIHELIEMAGGINIAEVGGEGYPTLALEEIISLNPQVIIVNTEDYEGGDASLQAILNESRLSNVDAVVNGQVYGINADLTNRPTPRIVDGLELMAQMIHPELFGAVQ
jgi:iron complex transport system substrate-binding protein